MVDAMLALCDRHGLEYTTFAVAAYHLRQVTVTNHKTVFARLILFVRAYQA